MNSRDRFATACQFGTPDRIPIDYQGHYSTDKNLMTYLGIRKEVELLEVLGSDFYYLPSRDISQNEGFIKCYKGPDLDISEKERICPFGIRWQRGAYDHKFSVDEAIEGPLEKAQTSKEILQHQWPKVSHFDFSPLIEECETHKNRVIIGGLWTGIMGDSYRIHGFENFLLNMVMNPTLIKTLIDKVTDVYLELNDLLFSILKGKMDVWFFGNDFGSQNGMLFSPEMWCEFFIDNIKLLTDLAHSYNLKVMMHSCGGIVDIIPYLLEAGVDILDPIQITAKGMDLEFLASEYGGRMMLHGGVDTQEILPFASPEEVVAHVKYVINTLNRNGGYIFAPSQILGPDIPLENILAMYKVARGESN
jgi:uroporphyrinogen decarboxylase